MRSVPNVNTRIPENSSFYSFKISEPQNFESIWKDFAEVAKNLSELYRFENNFVVNHQN